MRMLEEMFIQYNMQNFMLNIQPHTYMVPVAKLLKTIYREGS